MQRNCNLLISKVYARKFLKSNPKIEPTSPSPNGIREWGRAKRATTSSRKPSSPTTNSSFVRMPLNWHSRTPKRRSGTMLGPPSKPSWRPRCPNYHIVPYSIPIPLLKTESLSTQEWAVRGTLPPLRTPQDHPQTHQNPPDHPRGRDGPGTVYPEHPGRLPHPAPRDRENPLRGHSPGRHPGPVGKQSGSVLGVPSPKTPKPGPPPHPTHNAEVKRALK